MSHHRILDSSPVPLPPRPPSNPRKRSADTASLLTPPRTVKKPSRSRAGSAFDSADEEDHALPVLAATPRVSPGRDGDKEEAKAGPGNAIVVKRRKIDDLAAELSDERDFEDAFWTGGQSSSTKPKLSAPARAKAKAAPTRRPSGAADRIQSSRPPSSRRLSQSRSHLTTASRAWALPSPPPSRVRPPVTPPRKAAAARQRVAPRQTVPVRDSPNNPFLDDSPASIPSSPIEPRTPTARLERPTLTYVHRGRKQEFMNPHFNAPIDPRTLLPVDHPEFVPPENCAPRRLFTSGLSKSKSKAQTRATNPQTPPKPSRRALSPDPWDSDDDELPMPALPPKTLATEFEKAGAAEKDDDELPALPTKALDIGFERLVRPKQEKAADVTKGRAIKALPTHGRAPVVPRGPAGGPSSPR